MTRFILFIIFVVLLYLVFKAGKFFGKVEKTVESIKGAKKSNKLKRDTSNIDAADYEIIDDDFDSNDFGSDD